MMWLIVLVAFTLAGMFFADAWKCGHMRLLRVLQGVSILGFAVGYTPNAIAGYISETNIIPMRTSMLALLLCIGSEVIARWGCKKNPKN